MTDLFDSPVLRVEQPRKMLQTQIQFNILDADGTLLAIAAETTERSIRKAARAALPGNVLSGPQTLLMRTADDVPVLIIAKEDNRLTRVLRAADEAEENGGGEVIGTIRAERTTRHYSLLDADGRRLGEVTGDLSLRHFAVTDPQRKRVGAVNKKWAGLAAEVLTTADRYAVEISKPVAEPMRTLIVVTAIVLDLTLHESKDVV